MIRSKGQNNYQNQQFSFWDWSAPILQTPTEVFTKVKELNLIGRTIKDIIVVGMGYNWTDDTISEAVYSTCARIPDSKKSHITDIEELLPQEIDLARCAVLDEPLLIVFEDGDVLGISFNEGSSVRMELNTIPCDIKPGINRKTFHANRLFSDIIGKPIVDIEVTASVTRPKFTWSHGLDLKEQDSYITRISLIYDDGTNNRPYRKLSFHAFYDYCEIELIDYNGMVSRIRSEDILAIVEGYLEDERFLIE